MIFCSCLPSEWGTIQMARSKVRHFIKNKKIESLTNSDFLIPLSLQPNVVDPRYFKLWIMMDQIIKVWNIKGLRHLVLDI